MAEIKLKKRIKYAGDVFKALVEKGWFPGDTIELLQTIQDADVMDSIVRCHECKHWWKANELCVHPKCCEGCVAVVEAPADHYCGYGERREGE